MPLLNINYPNKYFIETGSYFGAGIFRALSSGLFQQIYSIELSHHYFLYCQNRFAAHPNVAILQGDSAELLPKLLEQIDQPATFWLDGHYSWEDTARGATNTPILRELEAIKNHEIKTHTILIDDMRQCGTIEFDFVELDDIKAKILEINPNYKIAFQDGFVKTDVLVACAPP